MATTFQQQATQRKIIYLGTVVVLFTVAWLWRQYVVLPQAQELALREEDVGEVEVVGQAVRLGMTGLRGLATCGLWMGAIEKQKKNQWNELELLVRAVTKLQPHFVTPWLFQSWNLAYNVSVESDQPKEKYFYVSRGIQLLAEGERQNRNEPNLRRELGFYHQHKICRSDENNVMRSLFNLSLIPPKDRDPANFRKDNGEIDMQKFAEFCKQHPHLVRRLHSPPLPYDPRREYPKFYCANAEEVLQFLEDSRNIPSLYTEKLEDETRYNNKEVKRNPRERFPVLPPRRDLMLDPGVWDRWTEEAAVSGLPDETDAYSIAGAWYSYSQESIPEPSDKMPGAPKPIPDSERNSKRVPRFMSIVIFRTAPARAQTFVAERLQEEGWYDGDKFRLAKWFGDETVEVGGGRAWSGDAWRAANEAWKRFGRRNLLWFELPSEEENKRRQAEEFAKYYRISINESAPPLTPSDLPPDQWERYEAFQFMKEYTIYRNMTNFHHFKVCSDIESDERTIQARKRFYEAEQLRVGQAFRLQALAKYEDPRALKVWLDLLLENEEFRKDEAILEQTMEFQTKYTDLYIALRKEKIQQELALQLYLGQAAMPAAFGSDWLALTLHGRATLQPTPDLVGPFDIDVKGRPLIPENVRKTIIDRRK